MIHYRSRARKVLLVTPLVALIGVQGCTSTPQYPTETPIEIRLDQPGMTVDLDAFRAQYANASLGRLYRHTRRAICARPPVPPRGCVAEVTIQALGKSNDIHPDRPMKEQYRLIARIRNLDAEDVTEMYSLKPISQAEYLVVIDNGGVNGLPRWNILEVPVSRTGIIRRTPRRNLVSCPRVPPDHPYPYSDVNFAECGEHRAVPAVKRAGIFGFGEPGSLLFRFVSLVRPAASRAEPGEWMGCPTGCCT